MAEHPTTDKKLDFWEDWLLKAYTPSAVEGFVAFFDHWLKGSENGVMDTPPVRLEVRSGRGASFLLKEQEWPLARTEYTRWYLDASPTADPGRLHRDAPVAEQSVTYSAEVDLTASRVLPPGKSAPCRGATFLSEPMAAECVIAGYSKLVVWVSATAADMDIHVGVRVLDAEDREVDYVGPALIPGTSNRFYPLTKGVVEGVPPHSGRRPQHRLAPQAHPRPPRPRTARRR